MMQIPSGLKILLTGMPGSGKSTLCNSVRQGLDKELWTGVISLDIRQGNERLGFKFVNPVTQEESVFAHKKLIQSKCKVGAYAVEVSSIDNFACPLLEEGMKVPGSHIVLLDEIGKMERFSNKFMQLVDRLIVEDLEIPVLATVSKKEPWAAQYRGHKNALLFEVTRDNRDELVDVLITMFKARNAFADLSPAARGQVLELSRKYIASNSWLQLRKLYDNAIDYVLSNKLEAESATVFRIKGRHGMHRVTGELSSSASAQKVSSSAAEAASSHSMNDFSSSSISLHSLTCDCSLYQGKGSYKSQGKGTDCSHIQSVLIHVASGN